MCVDAGLCAALPGASPPAAAVPPKLSRAPISWDAHPTADPAGRAAGLRAIEVACAGRDQGRIGSLWPNGARSSFSNRVTGSVVSGMVE